MFVTLLSKVKFFFDVFSGNQTNISYHLSTTWVDLSIIEKPANIYSINGTNCQYINNVTDRAFYVFLDVPSSITYVNVIRLLR